MSENIGGSRRRKAISATLAVAMVGTMLLSGTLAYFYQSKAINLFSNEKKAVVGHDDLGPMTVDAATGNRVYNKDVYVENTGDTPVWVRIKLREDFTLDKTPVTVGTGANADQLTQLIHKPAAGATGADLGIGSEAGDEAAAVDKDIHKYFTWTLGGAGKAFLSANDDLFTKDTNDSDGNGIYMSGTGDQVAHDDDDKGVELGSSANIKNTPSTADPTKFEYMPDCDVIDMIAYNSLSKANKRAYVGWVYDTTEAGGGWVYWSQMLKPGYATGKLLDQVTVSKDLANRQYEYNIHVDFEAVDENDQRLWTYDENHLNETAGKSTERASTSAIALMQQAQLIYDFAQTNAEIDEKIANIEAKGEDGSLGAIGAYKQAQNEGNAVLKQAYIDAAEQVQANYEANKEVMDQPLIQYDTAKAQYVLAAETSTIAESGDAEVKIVEPIVAEYLMKTYGNGVNEEDKTANQLTRGQAQGAVKLEFSDISGDGLDLTWMKAKDFPNLKVLKTAQAWVSKSFIETTDLAPGLLCLWVMYPNYGHTNTEARPAWPAEPFDVGKYQNLIELNMTGNTSSEIIATEEGTHSGKSVSLLPKLERLDLNSAGLQELPERLPNVHSLSLGLNTAGQDEVIDGETYCVLDLSGFGKLDDLWMNSDASAKYDAIRLPEGNHLCRLTLGKQIKKVINMPASSSEGFFVDIDSKLGNRYNGGMPSLIYVATSQITEIDIHNYTGIPSLDLKGCKNITKIVRNPDQMITGLDSNLGEVREYVVPLDDTLNEETHLKKIYPAAASK